MATTYHARSPWVSSVGMAFSGTMRGSPLRRSLGGPQSGTTRRPEHRAIRPEAGTVIRPEEGDTFSHTAPAEEEQTEAEREEQGSSYEGAPEELERQEQAGVALARAKLDRAVGRWSNVAGMPPIASVKRPYRPIDFGGTQGRREVSSFSDEPGRSASLLKPRRHSKCSHSKYGHCKNGHGRSAPPLKPSPPRKPRRADPLCSEYSSAPSSPSVLALAPHRTLRPLHEHPFIHWSTGWLRPSRLEYCQPRREDGGRLRSRRWRWWRPTRWNLGPKS